MEDVCVIDSFEELYKCRSSTSVIDYATNELMVQGVV